MSEVTQVNPFLRMASWVDGIGNVRLSIHSSRHTYRS